MKKFVIELVRILNQEYSHTGAHFDEVVELFVRQALKKSGLSLVQRGKSFPRRSGKRK